MKSETQEGTIPSTPPTIEVGGQTITLRDPGFAQYFAVRYGAFGNFAVTCMALLGICWGDAGTRPAPRVSPLKVETYGLAVLQDLRERGLTTRQANSIGLVVYRFLDSVYEEDEPSEQEVSDAVDFSEPPRGGGSEKE